MQSKLVDIDKWGITEAELGSLGTLACISVQLHYPDYQAFLSLLPRQRRQAISAQYRKDYKVLQAILPPGEWVRIGSHIRPIGVRGCVPLHQLPMLLQHKVVATMSIESIAGLEPAVLSPTLRFWCIQARFAIQHELQTTGMQLYEDRMLAILALSENEAQQKLRASFADYAKSYLNSNGELVRWQFEAFLDSYELSVSSPEEFGNTQGVEVFSTLRSRRLRPGMEWTDNM